MSFRVSRYGFETWSDTPGPGDSQYGYEDVDVSLVGLPEEEDWILQGPQQDDSLVQNVLTYNIARETGMYAARTRYCVLSIDGVFKGVYILMEKLKRGPDRIDISRNDNTSDLSGGWIVKLDKGWRHHNGFATRSASNTKFQYDYPDSEDVTDSQERYIIRYFTDFENRILERSPTYATLMDVDSFAHYLLLTEFTKNVDGYRISTWFHKDKGGLLKAGPMWDYNMAYSEGHRRGGRAPEPWVYLGFWSDDSAVPEWWEILVEDRSFQNAMRVRWAAMRQHTLTVESLNARIDAYISLLGEDTIDADADLWHRGNHDNNPSEIQELKDFIAQRIVAMDEHIANLVPTWGGPGAPTQSPLPAPSTSPTPQPPSPSPTPGPPSQSPSASPTTLIAALATINAESGCSAAEGQSYIQTAVDCSIAAAAVLGGTPSVRVISRDNRLPGCYWRPGPDDVVFNDSGDPVPAVLGRPNKHSICLGLPAPG